MVYLLNFNIRYIIILATCFDSYESSSGTISRTIVHIFYSFFLSYSFIIFMSENLLGLTARLSASRRILHGNVSEVVYWSRLCKSCGLKEGSRAEMYARRNT